ncbi:right-handed parallel beta-helix repeat-containing protein [Rathayibacter sp. AY1C5]|uniref:right-handed parallel beta-helix repeat-containing protein n=1 Tax=Rathayibacter sp. AY1C5 TaxID=2080538 RepID=UPI000CE9369F|nr:right-handed parallel beta-helix repeat-containing protein [Rathayibacter sp. AY1C5]PPG60269.1 hypothetical protein C5C57_05565 [Rathayibacter sp. AY1C5]
MSDLIQVLEDVVNVSVDETRVEVITVGIQGPPGAPPDTAVKSVAGRVGHVVLSKADVGLNLVDNTSDAAKPVSAPVQTALNAKYNSSNPAGFVDAFQAAASAPVQTVAGRQGAVTLVKGDVGLGNVDNTSDAGKPVSTATISALALKAPLASPAFTGTPTGITKAHVGLGSVDNTSDAAKPVSTATQAALDGKLQIGGDIGGTITAPVIKNVQKVFNVFDYGALGNGSDDTVAINAAMTAAGVGGVVVLPFTTTGYTIAGSLIPRDGQQIVGQRVRLTTSAPASGHNGMININNRANVTISGIDFEANLNVTNSYTAITSYGHTNLRIRDCSFTGTTNAFGGFVMLDGQNGYASMVDTFIDDCRFYSAAGISRSIHLYARSGRTVERTRITNCRFQGTRGPAIYLDPYSDVIDTLVINNQFKDILYGGSTTSVGVAFYIGVQTTGRAINSVLTGNNFSNAIISAGHQQGFAYFYNAYGIVISDNIMRGAWTPSQNSVGPALAPGRISTPSYNVLVTDNYIEGFDSPVDVDSQIAATYTNNIVANCGDGIIIGYNIQKYVKVNNNIFYNSPHRTTNVLMSLGGATTVLKCEVKDNIFIDDRAVPTATIAVKAFSHIDHSGVEITGNRFYVPNGVLTQTAKEYGDEVLPTVFDHNEFHDSAGMVSSVLAVAQGGTGSATKAFVDLLTAQTIAGTKTFTGNMLSLAPAGGNTELHIEGTTATQQYISFTKSGTFRWQMYMPGSSTDLRFSGGGSDRLVLQLDGKVGVGLSSPTSTFQVNGSLATKVNQISAATTLDATYCSVELNTTATQTLPALATCQGRMYEFVNINAAAATIKGSGTELIGNVTTANTYTLASGASATLKAFPSAWRVV